MSIKASYILYIPFPRLCALTFFSNSNFCNFNLIKYSNSHNTKLVSLNLTLIEYIEVHVCEYTNSIEVRKLIIAILRVFHITICYSNGWFAQVAIEARNLVGVERVELPNPASMVTAYWQKMLPHSPMPTAILELLNPPTGISLSLSLSLMLLTYKPDFLDRA